MPSSSTDTWVPVVPDLPVGHRRGAASRLAIGLVALAAFAAVSLLPSGSAVSAQETSVVSVVHGLRGELVDVYVDGEVLLPGFQPDRIADPTTVSAGPHTVELRPAGAPADSEPRASATPDLPPGPVAVVAHFAADGSWTMSVFANTVADLAPGSGELVFRNVSAATPVALELDAGSAADALATGQEQRVTTAADRHRVAVQSETGETLVPPDDVNLSDGSAVALYLVGEDSQVIWLRQDLGGTAAAPVKVDAGNSGLRGPGRSGERGSVPLAGLALVGVGLLLVGGGALVPRITRRRDPARS